MEPKFRRKPEGSLNMCDSLVALRVKEENKKKPWSRALSPDKVLETARRAVVHQGEDPSRKSYILGQHTMQFGVFRGQTFKWVAENALGYAGYLVASMRRETSEVKDSKNNYANKAAFAEYIGLFPEGREAICIKEGNMDSTGSRQKSSSAPQSLSTGSRQKSSSPPQSLSTGSQQKSSSAPRSIPSVSSVRTLLIGRSQNPQSIDKAVKKMLTSPVPQPGKQSLEICFFP